MFGAVLRCRVCGQYAPDRCTCGPAKPAALHPDDLILWPDGTACPASELADYAYMGDDYRRIPYDTPEWAAQSERHLWYGE